MAEMVHHTNVMGLRAEPLVSNIGHPHLPKKFYVHEYCEAIDENGSIKEVDLT